MSEKSKQAGPPKWAVAFLHRFCPPELAEGILGDLEEAFEEDALKEGPRVARRRFAKGVLRFLHPEILIRHKITKLKFINMDMFKSHLLVVTRSMMKYKFYSSINIIGLALAVAFIFLGYLFIESELRYDQFNSNKDKVYRLYRQSRNVESGSVDRGHNSAIVPIRLASDLKKQVTSVDSFCRVASNSGSVKLGENTYNEVIYFVDSDFLTLFDFPVLSGSAGSALRDPNGVILSTKAVEKYFGPNDPMGKGLTITLNDSAINFIVKGVFDTKHRESSITADVVVPFDVYTLAIPEIMLTSYNYSSVEAFITYDTPDVEKGISEILSSVIPQKEGDEARMEVGIQPLTDIHLNAEITGNASYTDPNKLYVIAGLGLLVLIVAIINFLTLATSHSLRRLKEMGLRNTMGAFSFQLRVQLIIESFFLSLLSVSIGLILAFLLNPFFNELLRTSFTFTFSPVAVVFVLGLAGAVALIGGGIQSAVLVKYKPADALKGKTIIVGKDSILNQSLTVVQFSLSILLIIGTLIIRSQMNYLQEKDIGYDKERLLEIGLQSPADLAAANLLLDRFRNEIGGDARILGVSGAMNSFTEPWTILGIMQEDETSEQIHYNKVDPNYVETMGIEIVLGKDFDKSGGSNKQILVNETLVEHFGWEDPLSEQIPGKNFRASHQIIGVMKDFHFSTLHNSIEPLAIAVDSQVLIDGVTGLSTYVWPINMYRMMVRVGPGNLNDMLLDLEATWQEVNPEQPFTYSFVDQLIAKSYAKERQWQKVIDSASLFSIVIAWLGLLGLTRLSVQKRVKEIGVRKVLGSTTLNVTSLLSRKFMLLIVASNMVAWPVAWFAGQKWLEAFAYRVDVTILPFVIGGVGVLIVALVSVGYQSYKAALANPVNALKHE